MLKFYRLIWHSGVMPHDIGTFIGSDLRAAIAAYVGCSPADVTDEMLSEYSESIEV